MYEHILFIIFTIFMFSIHGIFFSSKGMHCTECTDLKETKYKNTIFFRFTEEDFFSFCKTTEKKTSSLFNSIKHIFGLFWLLKVILKSDSDIDMSSFLHSCLKVKKWNEWRKKNIQQRTNNSFGVTMVIIKINSLIFSRKLLKYYSIRLIKYVKEVYLMNCSVVLPLAQWSCIHKFNRIYRAFFLNSCKQRKIHSIFSKSKKSCEKTGRNN